MSENLIDMIRASREGNRLEFKRAKNDLPHSFWETYSAFANTSGGLIVLGADEGADGLPVPSGMTDAEKVKTSLWNGLNNPQRASANVLVDSDVVVEEWDGQPLVVVRVPRADRRQRPVYVGNNPKTGTYRRNGEGDYHVTEEAYLSMVRDSLREPIDSVVLLEHAMDELCDETLRGYRNLFGAVRPKSPWLHLEDEAFLIKIGAAGRSAEDHLVHPTRAGLLMFGYAEEIVREFPHYFLDCRQVIDGNRWNNRITSSTAGEWSGNVYDFWHKANRMLSEGLPVPFRLRPDMLRDDDTPQHRAVREALTNALVHADYFGRAGVVAIRRQERVEVSNPGLLRIPFELIESGGISEARNESMLRIFSMVDIGERAGSGYDVLCEGTMSAGKPDPVYTEIYDPERVKLTMELETSGLVEFRLPGMGGESSPLVTKVDSPKRKDKDESANAVIGDMNVGGGDSNVGNDGGNVGNHDGNVGNDGGIVGNREGIDHRANTTRKVLLGLKSNPKMSAAALSRDLGLSTRQVERILRTLREEGKIVRIGGTRGYWKVNS